MLLTMEEMDFLYNVAYEVEDGKLIAKPGLKKKEKERLLAIDEISFMCEGEHMVKNYEELEE